MGSMLALVTHLTHRLLHLLRAPTGSLSGDHKLDVSRPAAGLFSTLQTAFGRALVTFRIARRKSSSAAAGYLQSVSVTILRVCFLFLPIVEIRFSFLL